MSSLELVSYLAAEIEPLKNNIYGDRYRAAVYLIDGTYLPCVVFQSRKRQVDLALKRFDQLKKEPKQYRDVVGSFVADGSTVASYDILRVEPSPFAWPRATLEQIHGETTMAWTAFVAEMSDGKRFSYGTSFRTEFFDLPSGYSFRDIKEIHSGMVHLEVDGTQPYTLARHKLVNCFREKPFFSCYLEGLAD
jgi:hypothetical protein